jgi:bacteriocin-like protein
MVPQIKQESDMSDEIHELNIDELETVSGGQIFTSTVHTMLVEFGRYFQWVTQRATGSKTGDPIPFGR